MRRVLFNLHLFIALSAALFVVSLGLTGAVMAFEPELDHLVHPRLFFVTPQSRPLTLEALAASAIARMPGGRVTGFGLSTSPDLSYFVAVGPAAVYLNQYTGEVLGIRQGPTLLGNIHQFHLRLLAGNPGKMIVSWAGVAMLFLVVSGLYLWWPSKRLAVTNAWATRRSWYDLHNSVGVVSLLLLLALTATGILIGFDDTLVPLLYKATRSEPFPASITVEPQPGVKRLTPDQAVAIAREALPGAVPILVNVPGPRAAYRVAARFPEDLTPGGRSRIHIDPYTGRVLLAESSRTTAAGTRMVILNRAIHTGDIFGLPSKAVVSLASLAAVVQVVTGLMMWVKRKQGRTPVRP